MDAINSDSTDANAETSVFHSNLSLEAKVERARTELLDLSARNRLLNVPRFSKSAKTIDFVDERSTEIYRILVTQGKPMTFLAVAKGRDSGEAEDEGLVELALPDDDECDESGRLTRHADTKLQTLPSLYPLFVHTRTSPRRSMLRLSRSPGRQRSRDCWRG